MNKFEKLIEYIINDEDQKARELFHDIVVEKSRDIYESIMDEESMEEAVAGNQVEDMVDEVGQEEAMGEDDEEGSELELGGDEEPAGDEFGSEEPASDEFGGAEESQEEVVMNIDAKLDELLAKFDEIMGAEEPQGDEFGAEEPAMGMGDEMGDMGAEEQPEQFAEAAEGSGKSGNPFAKKGSAQSGKSGSAQSGKSGSAKSGKSGKPFEGKQSTSELMREYVDRIGDIYGGAGDAAEGDAVGAAGKKTSVNTKYTGKQDGPDFGGKAVKTGTQTANQDGTSPTKASNEYTKGEGETPEAKQNVNVPGGTAGKTGFKNKEGSYESGGDSQGNPTGRMVGTGAKSEKQGEKNTKSNVLANAGKK
jgi:hypothetical protein